MVVPDGIEGLFQTAHRADNHRTHHWVLLDGFILLVGQLAGLSQDIIRDTDLADIVQQGRC